MALQEPRRSGVRPFCVNIDSRVRGYLSCLFGNNTCMRAGNAGETAAVCAPGRLAVSARLSTGAQLLDIVDRDAVVHNVQVAFTTEPGKRP